MNHITLAESFGPMTELEPASPEVIARYEAILQRIPDQETPNYGPEHDDFAVSLDELARNLGSVMTVDPFPDPMAVYERTIESEG